MPGEQLEAVLDDPAVREAVKVVLERSADGAEEIDWTDVSDRLSSGQWGRLIQEDIVVTASGGFTVANPEQIREQLERSGDGSGTSETDEIDGQGWTVYDKLAGLSALALFFGYWNTEIRNLVASFDNVVLAPLTGALPFYVVVVILAMVTGVYSSVLQSKLTDTEAIEAYQDRMNDLRERKEAAKERGDEEELDRIKEEQMEAMGDQMGMFKLQFRPMVWIMLMTIPVFLWLRWKVRGGHLGTGETGMILPMVGNVGWQEAALGPMPTWIVWYFFLSLAFRQIIQKTLNFRTSSSS